MGTPSEKKTINVTGAEIRELRDKLRQADLDIATMQAYRDDLVAKIKKRMGKAEAMKIDGVLAFTYAPTKSYAWAQFALAHPEIADNYKTTVEKEVLATDKLLQDHPALVAPFRTHMFLVK